MEDGPTPLVFPAAPAASTSVLDEEREAHRRRQACICHAKGCYLLLSPQSPSQPRPWAEQGCCHAEVPGLAYPCRAERFGTEYMEPEKRSDLRQQFRRERLRKDGFKTGLDLFDEVQPWSAAGPKQRRSLSGTSHASDWSSEREDQAWDKVLHMSFSMHMRITHRRRVLLCGSVCVSTNWHQAWCVSLIHSY